MTWPFENDTSAVTRRLSDARLGQNRFRNRLIGVIIFMAAAIMAFVSSYVFNITKEYAASTAYQGIFQSLSQEQLALLKSDSRIRKVGVYQSVGMTERENGITMGIVCSDEATLQLSSMTLARGSMPQAADELLVEKGYLNALGIKAGIGDTISVRYRNQASRQLETKAFRITGLIETTAEKDKNRVAYNAVVSQDFVRENPALAAEAATAMIAVRAPEKYTNQELKELVRKIGADCGILANDIQVNNLYIDSNNLSGETALAVLLVGLALIGVSALVIYNIFYISVVNDVASFGQLRTIGTTRKQIRRILSREGNLLARRFIPPGCVAGGMLTFLADRNAFLLFSDVIIMLLSGMIVFVCVRLSIRKPARIAMSVSPVEAYRYNSYNGRCLKKSIKSKNHLTPFSLAAMNLFRNGKRSVLTFISLVLSGMMFVGISSVLSSLDPQQRAKQSFPYGGNYVVELNRALLTPAFSLTQLQQNSLLTDELKQHLLAIDGVEQVVCQQEILAGIDEMGTVIMGMNTEDYETYQHNVIDGTLPKPEDAGRRSLVVNMGSTELAYLQKSYEVGDTVTFSQRGTDSQNGLTYDVSAVIIDRNSAVTFILPEEEMRRAVPYNANSAFVVRTAADDDGRVEHALRELVSASDSIRLKSLEDMVRQYKSLFGAISVAVSVLLAVLVLFGIINLVNTSMTNIISRRREMGLFRAVGMESRQMHHMIRFEHVFQIFGSFAASFVCGLVLGRAVCAAIGNVPGFGFVNYTFPAVPILMYGLLVFMLQLALTKWAVLYCRKNSVVEQIRVTE